MSEQYNRTDGPKWKARQILSIQLSFLIVWVVYLFYPILSSILEITWIQLARELVFLDWFVFTLFYPLNSEFGIDYFIVSLLGLYVLGFLLYYIKYRNVWTRSLQKQRLILIVILPFLWLSVAPISATYYARLRASYKIGGHLYLAYAGGAEQVRQDAVALLDSGIEGEVQRANMPDSLTRFYSNITVDQEQKLVHVYLGSRCGMCGSWQILIFDDQEGSWMPDFVDPLYTSIYQLSEGIYLFHR